MLHTSRGPEWTDCDSHKPWPRMDRLCFTQAVAQNGQTVLHTSCVAKETNGQMDRLCFTEAVADDDDELMLNVLRCHLTY